MGLRDDLNNPASISAVNCVKTKFTCTKETNSLYALSLLLSKVSFYIIIIFIIIIASFNYLDKINNS